MKEYLAPNPYYKIKKRFSPGVLSSVPAETTWAFTVFVSMALSVKYTEAQWLLVDMSEEDFQGLYARYQIEKEE